ncbi:MAG: hypothetical protein ACI8TQ_001921 [Planctomycetota bacterium]|jgi:hypothetical protein
MPIMRYLLLITLLVPVAFADRPRNEKCAPDIPVVAESREFSVGDRTIYISSSFARSVNWGGPFHGARDLEVWSNEKDPISGDWHQSTTDHSVAFDVHDVTGLGADTIVVGGYSERFDHEVIELWDLAPTVGGYQAWRGGQTVGIGTPIPTSSIVEGIEGAQFLLPAARSPTRPPSKSELFRGDLGGIVAIEADPEGRFVLVLSDEHDCVYLIDVASGTKQVVLDASTSAVVASSDGIRALEHSVEGRMYIVGDNFSDEYVFMQDPDNDGDFDSFLELDRAGISATDFTDNTLMKDFVNQMGGANFF